jgi:hypothetical protein
MTQILGKLIIKSSKKKYIKIKRNQLLILDALLDNGGGIQKKYVDKTNNLRYSEHSGNFGLTNQSSTIDRIIISTRSMREDSDDKDILLPYNLYDSYKYKYFFHTHPPTPFAGGRAKDGILYEFPSISDIFHFIDHYNAGITLGSLVVAPEGYYIIRPKNYSIKKIKVDIELENSIFEQLSVESMQIQELAIKQFGSNFTEEFYYTNIASNNKYLKMFNKLINKYLENQLNIIIKHRIKDKLINKWIIKELYLPI